MVHCGKRALRHHAAMRRKEKPAMCRFFMLTFVADDVECELPAAKMKELKRQSGL